jgi:hypothetical protein
VNVDAEYWSNDEDHITKIPSCCTTEQAGKAPRQQAHFINFVEGKSSCIGFSLHLIDRRLIGKSNGTFRAD